MDWGLIQTVLTTVFGIIAVVSIIIALRLARRKKPVWAYITTKIIGLDTKAPTELKLVFNDKVVPDVYRTICIFFNRGNDTIRRDDVTDKISVLFSGAQMLRDPYAMLISSAENRLSTKPIAQGNDSGAEIDFLYLDHNDGVVIEALHTKCDQIKCEGNIMGAGKPRYIGEFVPHRDKLSGRKVIAYAISALIPLVLIVPMFFMAEGTESLQHGIWYYVWVLSAAWWGYCGILIAQNYLRYAKFPKWSVLKE